MCACSRPKAAARTSPATSSSTAPRTARSTPTTATASTHSTGRARPGRSRPSASCSTWTCSTRARSASSSDALGGPTMAEILALGVSHYPPLAGPDDRMAFILRRMLQNPKLPASLREPAGWPQGMRTEWGADEGVSAARQHRSDLVAALMKTRAALAEFDPAFVATWGDNQNENFKAHVV